MRRGRECKQFLHIGRAADRFAGQSRRARRDFWRSSIVQRGAKPLDRRGPTENALF
jgi:hypothetical protein